MPDIATHPAGTFCYAELASTDPTASGEFYTALFGWGRNDQDMGAYGIYTQFLLRDRVVAAQFRLPDDQPVPTHWCQYVSVPDADATTRQAVDLGAEILMGPLDVMDYGRMTILNDPQGAKINLWQPRANIGVGVLDEPGAMCWNELMSPDPAASTGFYGALFGWGTESMDLGEMGTYTVWTRGAEERAGGGMVAITAAMKDVPPNWLIYFQVADPAAVAARAGELGGAVVVPPTDIPGAGRFAVLSDPAGGVFGIYLSRR
ncbi:VOC family protein [bacterium]|nr:VOC family protein [bacterium]